jgi:peptidoglycan glycosyltransferase
VQVLEGPGLRSREDNQRALLTEYSRERGPILVGSEAVARSIPTDDAFKYLRSYPQGAAYAPITGFYSMVYGATGLESKENDILSGNDGRFFVDRLQQLLANRQPKGGAIRLTINDAAQQAAYKMLRGRTGAVVALDPRTGAILALVSSPSFDPNVMSSHKAQKTQDAYNKLNKNASTPLLNRPLAMTLPPGSVFKLVTAAAALESGKYTPSSTLPGPAAMPLPQSSKKLGNWTGRACGSGGKVTLRKALMVSCNTAFAWLGMQLGEGALSDQAKKFGFDTQFTVPMTAATSHFPVGLDQAQLAMSAIGQYDVQASALQMALVTAGIANNGVVMKPYLVSQVLGPDLSVLANASPQQLSRAMRPENAKLLRDMMVDVVSSGTGSNARISGTLVGGKTGTAENAPGESAHAWFVGLAPAGAPEVVVAVVLEHGGGAREVSGNGLAAPIAKAVMLAVLGK